MASKNPKQTSRAVASKASKILNDNRYSEQGVTASCSITF